MAQKKQRNLGHVIDLLKRIPADVFENIRDTRPPQARKGLVEMFEVNDAPGDKILHELANRNSNRKLP